MSEGHQGCGRGDESGPEDPDCGHRKTKEQRECALAGCGFCRAAEKQAGRPAVRYYRYAGNQAGWWVAFMDEVGFITVTSDWGDYGYCWSARGEGVSMRQWISVNMAKSLDYVAGKFSSGRRFNKADRGQLEMFMEKVWPHVCAAAAQDLADNP